MVRSVSSREATPYPPWGVADLQLQMLQGSSPAPRQEMYKPVEEHKLLQAAQKLTDLVHVRSGTTGLRAGYNLFGSNRDGNVTPRSFCLTCERLNLGLNETEATALMRRFDTTGKGFMNFEDFAQRLVDLQGQEHVEGAGVYCPPPREVMLSRQGTTHSNPGSMSVMKPGSTVMTGVGNFVPSGTFKKPLGGPSMPLGQVEKVLREKIRTRTGTEGANFELRKAFRHFDRDGSGLITFKEFIQALRWFNIELNEETGRELFSRYDSNNDGLIDYLEFSEWLLNSKNTDGEKPPTPVVQRAAAKLAEEQRAYLPEKDFTAKTFSNFDELELAIRNKIRERTADVCGNYRKAFRLFDIDGKGRITYDDMKQFMDAHNFWLDNNELGLFMARYDVDGKGYLTFEDFTEKLLPPMYAALNNESDQIAEANKPAHQPGAGHYNPDKKQQRNQEDLDFDMLEHRLRMDIRKITGVQRGFRTGFKFFDQDSTGRITLRDFGRVLNQVFGYGLNHAETESFMGRYDKDGKGFITFSEFSRFLMPKGTADENVIIDIPFDDTPNTETPTQGVAYPVVKIRTANDRPRSEMLDISPDEIQSLLREKIRQKTGTDGAGFELRKAFKNFDRDGSGKISADEFFQALEWFNIILVPERAHDLYKLYDKDGDGKICYHEFERGVNDARKLPPSDLGYMGIPGSRASTRSGKASTEPKEYVVANKVFELPMNQTLPTRFQTPERFHYPKKLEHPAFTTTSSKYGSKQPSLHEMPTKYAGLSNQFSSYAARGGMPRNNCLNTTYSRSKVHETFDAFNGFVKF